MVLANSAPEDKSSEENEHSNCVSPARPTAFYSLSLFSGGLPRDLLPGPQLPRVRAFFQALCRVSTTPRGKRTRGLASNMQSRSRNESRLHSSFSLPPRWPKPFLCQASRSWSKLRRRYKVGLVCSLRTDTGTHILSTYTRSFHPLSFSFTMVRRARITFSH